MTLSLSSEDNTPCYPLKMTYSLSTADRFCYLMKMTHLPYTEDDTFNYLLKMTPKTTHSHLLSTKNDIRYLLKINIFAIIWRRKIVIYWRWHIRYPNMIHSIIYWRWHWRQLIYYLLKWYYLLKINMPLTEDDKLLSIKDDTLVIYRR